MNQKYPDVALSIFAVFDQQNSDSCCLVDGDKYSI